MNCILSLLHSIFFLLILVAPVSATLTVTFAEKATVTGDRILLGDIARISPTDDSGQALGRLVIANAPAPGKSKTLQTPSVISSLRNNSQASAVQWVGKREVVVNRQAIKITRDQLYNIIAEFLADNKENIPKGDIRFTSMRAPSEVFLPYGKLSWRVTPSRPNITDSSSFSVFFKVDGKPARNCTVRGRVEILTDIAVATETIRKGTVIRPEQITMKRKNIVAADHPVFKPENVIGMQAARTIGAGKVVEHDHITSPPVISAGDLVKVIAGKGHLSISTKGVARSAGIIGDTIRVKNIRSNKLIYARVEGPGMVSVEF
jgi:flagella basal body P-ring formation protein FlgA